MEECWDSRLECVTGRHPPSKTPVGVLPWTCRSEGKRPSRQTGGQSNPHKRLASRKILSVEELETLPAGTKPRTSHYRSPGGERRGKRKRSTIFLERTKNGHRQANEQWNCFKGTLEKRLRDGMERMLLFSEELLSCFCFFRPSSLAAGQPTPGTDRQRHLSLHPVLDIAMGHQDCATLPGL